jgi:hypothetical protein
MALHKGPKFQEKPESGCVVAPVYTRRSMTVYVIPSSELKIISHLNTMAMVFFSIGSFVLSSALSIYIDASFSNEAQPVSEFAKTLKDVVAPILLVGTAIFYGLGIWQLITKYSTLRTIKEESVEITAEQP